MIVALHKTKQKMRKDKTEWNMASGKDVHEIGSSRRKSISN